MRNSSKISAAVVSATLMCVSAPALAQSNNPAQTIKTFTDIIGGVLNTVDRMKGNKTGNPNGTEGNGANDPQGQPMVHPNSGATMNAPVQAPPPPAYNPRASFNPQVQQAQSMLNWLGYDAGQPDGLTGQRTRNAVRAFQQNYRLPVTGQIEVYLMHHLNGAVAARQAQQRPQQQQQQQQQQQAYPAPQPSHPQAVTPQGYPPQGQQPAYRAPSQQPTYAAPSQASMPAQQPRYRPQQPYQQQPQQQYQPQQPSPATAYGQPQHHIQQQPGQGAVGVRPPPVQPTGSRTVYGRPPAQIQNMQQPMRAAPIAAPPQGQVPPAQYQPQQAPGYPPPQGYRPPTQPQAPSQQMYQPAPPNQQYLIPDAKTVPRPKAMNQHAPTQPVTARPAVYRAPQMAKLTKHSSGSERSMRGLEPIGPLNAPGCGGIEVVGYAEKAVIRGGERLFFMALRNKSTAAKIVKVDYVGGLNLLKKKRSGTHNVKVSPGDIQSVEIDYSLQKPEKIAVRRCL